MPPLLQVRSLSKNFGYLRVLEDINFNLDHGEVIGRVGRRGAGKSTLLNLIGGLHLPISLLRERPGILNDEQRQLIGVARAFCRPVPRREGWGRER